VKQPLVSVICLCYNHQLYVQEAIESVLNQTWSHIELIVVDDASTDTSREVIRALQKEHHLQKVLLLEKNMGNCAAFNRGLAIATGDFIIDLAADDVLMPDRIQIGVQELEQKRSAYGVHFSDAEYINESGRHLGYHSERFPYRHQPGGDLYAELIQRYFICPPTVMCRRAVHDKLQGYDESLRYEDFDFLIRAARYFQFAYSPNVLVKRRVVKNSLATKQFRWRSEHAESTFRICEKILEMNQTRAECKALTKRIAYEIRLCLRQGHLALALHYILLWRKNRQRHYPS
jgi:glycosyltransferase involved in cell wall biosynthesis